MKVLILFISLFIVGPAFAATSLFISEPGSFEIPPESLRSRKIKIDWTLLQNTKAGKIVLNYFDDVQLEAQKTALQWRDEISFSWFGEAKSQRDSAVILTIEKGRLTHARTIGQYSYQVLQTPDPDIYIIAERKLMSIPRDEDDVRVAPENAKTKMAQEIIKPSSTDDGSYIDILVLYTSQAAQIAGDINGVIQNAVDYMNAALRSSQISLQVRLVYAGPTSYVETGTDLSIDLNRLTNMNDGYIEEVFDLRTKFGADLVSLWTVGTASVAGLGWLNNLSTSRDLGFSVTGVYSNNVSSFSPIVFSHEVGHNLGCHHDRANASGTGAFSYSYGYYDSVNGFGTIMSYLGTIIMSYSNPNVNYNGAPTGVDSSSGTSADNAKTINAMKAHIAAYTDTKVPFNDATTTKFVTEGCFVATAVYGSTMESEVGLLRKFRNEHLKKSTFGRWFITQYYKYSPALAHKIRDDETLRTLSAAMLFPFVQSVKIYMEYFDEKTDSH